MIDHEFGGRSRGIPDVALIVNANGKLHGMKPTIFAVDGFRNPKACSLTLIEDTKFFKVDLS